MTDTSIVGQVAPVDTRPTAGLRRAANANGERSRKAALAACRALMVTGTFRPDRTTLRQHGISRKIVERHFGTLAGLYEEALDDTTRAGIVTFLMPKGPWPCIEDSSRIIRAAVWGRITQ